MIPPVVLFGENDSSSSLASSSCSFVEIGVVNLGTTVNRRGLGVDVSKNLWISSSSALSGLGVGGFLPPTGFLETDDAGVVLLRASSPVGLLEVGEGDVLPRIPCLLGFFDVDAGVVLARMSSLFGLREAGWKRLGLRRRGVVAAVLVFGWIEFLVRSRKSSRESFFVVVFSDVVVEGSVVVVVTVGVLVVVLLVVTFVVPFDVIALTPSMLPSGISMILSTLNPSTVTVGLVAARVVAMSSSSS